MNEYYLISQMDINNKIIQKVNDSFNHIKNVLLRSKKLYKRYADKNRITDIIDDLVWIQAPPSINIEDSSNLEPCKYGPYKITNVLHHDNYEINISKSPFPKHHPIFHVSELETNISNPKQFSDKNNDPGSFKDIVKYF